MIKGINVLHQYETGHPDVGMQIFLCVIAVALLGFVIWNIIRKIRHRKEIMPMGDMIFLTSIAVVLFGVNLWIGSWVPHTEYKVTIDESVSYVEFVENYEVIHQEGAIYTIREVVNEGE